MGAAPRTESVDALVEAFNSEPPPSVNGPKCNVAKMLSQMPPQHVEAFTAVLAKPDWTNRNIVAKLSQFGYDIKIQSVMRHRRGDCKCPKS